MKKKKKLVEWKGSWLTGMPKWNFANIKNKYIYAFILSFFLSWILHEHLFLRAFDFETRFYPTWAMGFLSCYLILKTKSHK